MKISQGNGGLGHYRGVMWNSRKYEKRNIHVAILLRLHIEDEVLVDTAKRVGRYLPYQILSLRTVPSPFRPSGRPR